MEYKNIVIGIGNPNMGDDAIGIEIVNCIEKLNTQINLDTHILFYISFEIIDKILPYKNVIIVDAADLGWKYGEWKFLKYNDINDSLYIKNSHNVSLFQILKTGYQIFDNNMPKNLYILLIQTKTTMIFKKGIGKELRANIPSIIEEIYRYLQKEHS